MVDVRWTFKTYDNTTIFNLDTNEEKTPEVNDIIKIFKQYDFEENKSNYINPDETWCYIGDCLLRIISKDELGYLIGRIVYINNND